MLVEDFVHQFNQDREQYFIPSSELVADESMSAGMALADTGLTVAFPCNILQIDLINYLGILW